MVLMAPSPVLKLFSLHIDDCRALIENCMHYITSSIDFRTFHAIHPSISKSPGVRAARLQFSDPA
jgi:hypothetical protein